MKLGTVTFFSTLILSSVLATPARLAAHDASSKFITFDAVGADTTPQSYNGTVPASINNWGEITGTYYDVKGTGHAFLRSPWGNSTTVDLPGSQYTQASSINDLGVIAGLYYDAQGNEHGFLRSPGGKFTTLDIPGAIYVNPLALNLEGVVVGNYQDSSYQFHAFLRFPGGKYVFYDGPGACSGGNPAGCYGSGASNINIYGMVAGGYEDNGGNFVHHELGRSPAGKLFVFDAPGAGNGPYQGTGCPGCSLGINQSGAIAGTFIDLNYVSHGYLRSPEGHVTTFDAPGTGTAANEGTGCPSDCPVRLNDAGSVVGTYIDANYVFHGFLRSPRGRVITFDAPGAGTGSYQGTACQFCGLGINDAGAITGSYIDANNVYHGFLRIPKDD